MKIAKEAQVDQTRDVQLHLIEATASGQGPEALSILPKSTKYWWRHRMNTIWTLCTWAAWCHARKSGVQCPTMEAVWGTTGLGLFNYQDTKTGVMMTARECPKGSWTLVNEISGNVRTSTDKVVSGVNLTGLAVQHVLKDELGQRIIKDLWELLPIVGVYAPPIWSTLDQDKLHLVLAGEAHSLRNLERIIDPEEQRIVNLANHVLGSDSVVAAIKALDFSSPMVPKENRVQPRFELRTDVDSVPVYHQWEHMSEALMPKSHLKN